MKVLIGISAVLLMIWPAIKMINALYKVGIALFSGTLNIYGKLFIILLVIVGFIVGFPWNIITAVLVFLIIWSSRIWW
jgi:hypothetical protein